MSASGRTLSRIARVTARGQAGDYLAPARLRAVEPDVKPRRVLRRLPLSLLWFLKRRRLSLLLQEGRFSPRFRLFCRILPGVFEPVRILFPVAIGGIAGMTASAAGSGGAVCPSTAAGGVVIFFVFGCTGCWVWGLCARRLLRLGQSLLVLRLRCLLELVVRLLPLRCMVCLACLALPGVPGAPGVPGPMHCQVTSSLVGVGVARPVVGSTGGTWLRWRSLSPVASSRRSGGSTGLPRFEVLVALAPETERTFAFGRSFCSVSGSAPSSLVASWCGSLGACLPFVPCLFLWSLCHSRVNGQGAGEVLPIGLFPLSAFRVALPPLWWWQAREAESCGPIRSSGRLPGACSSLSSSPLTLPGVVMTFPVCLSRAPALRQVSLAMLAEGTLESPSVLVLAFHSSLFLVEGSSDGSAPGDRFPLPWADVFIHAVFS